jgi:hypothetical protein
MKTFLFFSNSSKGLELNKGWLCANSVCEINSEATHIFNDLEDINLATGDGSSSSDCEGDNSYGDALY